MTRTESLQAQFDDLMDEARRLLMWRNRQLLMAHIDKRLEAERDLDDQEEAA